METIITENYQLFTLCLICFSVGVGYGYTKAHRWFTRQLHIAVIEERIKLNGRLRKLEKENEKLKKANV